MWSIKKTLNWAIGELKKNNVSEPEGSATLLLMNVLGKDRAYIYAHGELVLSMGQLKKNQKYIDRRKSHEPVWYILGEVEFYGRKFFINNDVMTPRPETEFLVKEILSANSKPASRQGGQLTTNSVIELGTGSGAIIVTIAKELICHPERSEGSQKGWDSSPPRADQNDVRFIATDISDKALKVAKKNARLQRVKSNIEFLQGDLLEPLTTSHYPSVNSLLIANLPYIPHEDMNSLQFDIQHHEPRIALDGGRDGMEIYERLIKQMKELNFSGKAFFEIGIGQGKLLKKMVGKYFSKAKVGIKKDLAGIDRIAVINIQ